MMNSCLQRKLTFQYSNLSTFLIYKITRLNENTNATVMIFSTCANHYIYEAYFLMSEQNNRA